MLTLEACCICSDPEFPFYDYKQIEVRYSQPDSDGFFGFAITADSIHYLACYETIPGFLNGAYACSCNEDGNLGEKFRVEAINIYADSVFDTSIDAGDPLNSLFEISTFYNNVTGMYEKIPLDSAGDLPVRLSPYRELYIDSKSVPVAFNRPYYFKIEIVKDNGSVVEARVGPLTWTN
jgi:hypothetical protein